MVFKGIQVYTGAYKGYTSIQGKQVTRGIQEYQGYILLYSGIQGNKS